jgi:hypothetical protein
MEDELQRPAALSRKQRVPPGIGIDTYFFRNWKAIPDGDGVRLESATYREVYGSIP